MSCGRLLIWLLPVLLLGACGVDGPPEPPERREATRTGATVTLSGEAAVGIVGRS